MSYQAVEWAFYKAPMLLTGKGKPDTTARQVLGVLAEHANEAGNNARPSVLRIRFATGLDERTIERALLRLQAAKLITMTGRTITGTRKWSLALNVVRPESEWDEMVDAAEAERELESKRRKDRRHRNSRIDPEVPERDVRDSASRTPGFCVRTSGTESTGVRDSASGVRDAAPPEPPEPPEIHTANLPLTTLGGTLPPSPLRPQSPSAPGTGQQTSLAVAITQAQDRQLESLPREDAPPAVVVEIRPGASQEAAYRPTPRWSSRGTDAIAEATARRAAARAAYQAQLEAQ